MASTIFFTIAFLAILLIFSLDLTVTLTIAMLAAALISSTIFLAVLFIIAFLASAFVFSHDLTVIFTIALFAITFICFCRPRSPVKARSAPNRSQAQDERRWSYTSKELMAKATKHTLADAPTLKDLESLGPPSKGQQAMNNRDRVTSETGSSEPEQAAPSSVTSTSRTSFPYPPFDDNAAAEEVFWVVLVGEKPGCFRGRRAALRANPNIGGKAPLPTWTKTEANKILSLAVKKELVRHL